MYPYKSFYHFKTDALSWYVLDSGSSTLGPSQLDLFEEHIKKDSTQAKVVLTHCPVYGEYRKDFGYFTMQNSYEADRLITVCEKNGVKMFIDGHNHIYTLQQLGSFTELTVPPLTAHQQWNLLRIDEASSAFKIFLVENSCKTADDFKTLLGLE